MIVSTGIAAYVRVILLNPWRIVLYVVRHMHAISKKRIVADAKVHMTVGNRMNAHKHSYSPIIDMLH